MSTEVEIAAVQLKREIEHAQRLFNDDLQLDWKSYSIVKNALLAVVPLLPSEITSQVRELLKSISAAYLHEEEEGE